MLLAIDIGNTNINSALINHRGRIARKYTAPAERPRLGPLFSEMAKRGDIDKIFVMSVVPRALRKVKNILKKSFNNDKLFIVGENIKVPLKCEYNKRQIGQDRLVTAFAASSLYGMPILVVDFGTAVTFDVVSGRKKYLGGLILPGIKMSLESLSERTAMLPRTYLKKTGSFIGKNTKSSIRNGMIYGYSSLCDGLTALFRKKIGRKIKIIATGGDAPLICKYSASVKKIDLNLSLKGLYLLSKKV